MRKEDLCWPEKKDSCLPKQIFGFLFPLMIVNPAFADNLPEMVIYRDVPQHNAFRAGDKGQATAIATARPDLVTSSTRQTSAAPEGLSDAMLGMVGGHAGGAGDGLAGQAAGSAGIVRGGMVAMPGNAGASFPTGSAMAPAASIGSSISHSMAPLGAAFQALPGMK